MKMEMETPKDVQLEAPQDGYLGFAKFWVFDPWNFKKYIFWKMDPKIQNFQKP